MTALAPHLSAYLLEHLPRDRAASRHTIAAYAFSFQLLVAFAAARLKVRPCDLEIESLDAPLVLDFLRHLETSRANTARTRNTRLAAIKAFFRYLEHRVPACLEVARQVRALPRKRHDEGLVGYLTRSELQALLDAPSLRTAGGLRDRAMIHLAYACGLRVSELVGLTMADLDATAPDTVHIMGKGRRARVLPLWKETKRVLKDWLKVRPQCRDQHVFLSRRGEAMTRHGFADRLAVHAAAAAKAAPTLTHKTVSPHVLRHTCAIHTLEATGDIRRVALWLGHASITSTEIYLRVDPTEKLDILNVGTPPLVKKGVFNGAADRVLQMLTKARER
ncbi:MAG: tyrosine-type recombinase/integrase [Beijerinckiaceae bacterium]|jgi:site-specific recombinase XerD|nr:tyrosine-type recombinase/integrase [Beijerinckiaceae bacterium]